MSRALCLAAAFALLALSFPLAGMGNRAQTEQKDIPLAYVPSRTSARLTSLGHFSAVADLYWIKSLIYFASEMTSRRKNIWLGEHIDVVIELDPTFYEVYPWAGAAFIFKSEHTTWEDVQRANGYLDQGRLLFPSDWRLDVSAAANCSYYIENPSPELKEKLQECRRTYLLDASRKPGAPDHTISLALRDQSDECSLARQVYATTSSDEVRGYLRLKMKGLLCDLKDGDLDAVRVKEEALHRSSRPYVPLSDFVHLQRYPNDFEE